MKNKFLRFTSFLFLVVLGQSLFAQHTQSKLLDIPVQPGSRYINFKNSSSIVTTDFPINTSSQAYQDFVSDGGFSNISGLDDYYQYVYCGQAPRFASQTIVDADGKLVAFIVDNYIYDENGNWISWLNQANASYIMTCYDSTQNPFAYYGINPNIIVYPKNNGCDSSGYYIFYAVQSLSGGGAPMLYCIDFNPVTQNIIERSISFPSSKYINVYTNYALTASNPDGDSDNLLFVLRGNTLGVVNVSEIDILNYVIPRKTVDLSSSILTEYSLGAINRPDMAITSFDEDNYLLATSVHMAGSGVALNNAAFIKVPKEYDDISNTTIDENYVYISGYHSIGFEFSPNSRYLYFNVGESTTYTDIRYFDLNNSFDNNDISLITSSNLGVLNLTGDYNLTELELGRDGKLYAIRENGTITAISGSNNPATATAAYNVFGVTCKKMNRASFNSYNPLYPTLDDKAYFFSFQFDGSTYEEYWPHTYSDQPDWGTIGSTVTWSPGAANNPFGSESGAVYFDEDFVIPSGKYIQFNNMNIYFANGKKALVNTGSTLRIVGTKLTADDVCSPTAMWSGVYLEGNTTLDQSTANQGRLRMDAGSEISDAITGVTVEGGAICQIYAGDFINNKTGIYFYPYTHPTIPAYNAALIQLANFTTNKALNNGTNPYYMIIMQSVKGITISSSNFTNTRENSVGATSRGYGIRSLTSDFRVQYSDISGLYYGLYSTSGTPKVSNNSFFNNFRSVYASSGVNVEIVSNDFDGDFSFTPGSGNAYSTYIAGTGAGNTLYRYLSNTIQNGSVGAQFYNMGPNAVKVKDNTFLNISGVTQSCAAVAVGKNSDFLSGDPDLIGATGLEFRCNTFDDNPYAISVIDGNIRKYQGEQGASVASDYAGNAFDHYGTNTERDFYVDPVITSSLDLPMYYYYSHSDNAHKLLYYTTGRVTNVNGLYSYSVTDCDEDDGGGVIGPLKGSGISNVISLIDEIDTEIMLVESELNDNIDGGNTTSLLSQTEVMNNENSKEIFGKIAELNGFISDEAAITLINNNNINQFEKANALLENSPLPKNVVEELNSMEMNPALKNIIINKQNGVNAREQKQIEIADLKQSRALIINEMVVSVSNDETNKEEKEKLMEFLENDNNLQSKFHLMNLQKNETDFASAHATLETIKQMVKDYETGFRVEYENFIELEHILTDIEAGVISVEEAVAANADLLNTIASTESYLGQVAAQQLLSEAGVSEYEEVIKLPEPSVAESPVLLNSKNIVTESKEYSDIINVYPNPATDKIFVEYAFFNFDGSKSVEIYGINGNLIYRETLKQPIGLFSYNKKLPAGNYIIKIGDEFNQKITIQ